MALHTTTPFAIPNNAGLSITGPVFPRISYPFSPAVPPAPVVGPTMPTSGQLFPVSSCASSATLPSAPVNTAAPVVTGSLVTGGLLTCNPGNWTGAESFVYVWLRSGDGVSNWQDRGERGPTLVISDSDGKYLCCDVYGINAGGISGAVRSASRGPVVAVDPHWANVVLLLDGDTVATDLSSKNRAVGNLTGITSESGALKNATSPGFFVTCGSSQDFNTLGDWTIEFWITPQVAASGYLMSKGTRQYWDYSAGGVLSPMNYGGGSFGQTLFNARTHIALSRRAHISYLFKNGVHVATSNAGEMQAGFEDSQFAMFGLATSPNNGGFKGLIEDLRWTKGVGRWDASSPPHLVMPAGPYLVTDGNNYAALRSVGVLNAVTTAAMPLAMPPATVAGDLLVALMFQRSAPIDPDGWTKVSSAGPATGSAGTITHFGSVYIRTATAGDITAGSATFNQTTDGVRGNGVILALRGTLGGTVVLEDQVSTAEAVPAGWTTKPIGTLTAAGAGRYALATANKIFGGQPAFSTVPTGWEQLAMGERLGVYGQNLASGATTAGVITNSSATADDVALVQTLIFKAQ